MWEHQVNGNYKLWNIYRLRTVDNILTIGIQYGALVKCCKVNIILQKCVDVHDDANVKKCHVSKKQKECQQNRNKIFAFALGSVGVRMH